MAKRCPRLELVEKFCLELRKRLGKRTEEQVEMLEVEKKSLFLLLFPIAQWQWEKVQGVPLPRDPKGLHSTQR